MLRRFPIMLMVALLGASSLLPSAYADGEGQEDLDRATETKLTARNLRDLDTVCELCESAIEKGLDDESEAFAKDLWASTLYEYANRLAQPVFEQQPPDPRWQFMRDQAMPRLDKALELKPDWGAAHFMVARWQSLQNGDRERAREAIQLAVDNIDGIDETEHSNVYLWRGNLSDDEDERLEYFNLAIETDPENLDALRVRAFYHALQEDIDAAVADFRTLMEQEPENDAYRQALIDTLTAGEQYDAALEEIAKIIEDNPEQSEGYMMRARLHLIREDNESALTDLTMVLEQNPRDLLALLLRSRVHLDLEMLEEAREDVDLLLTLSPDLVDGILTRSLIAIAEEDYEAAIEDMDLLVRARPDNLGWQLQLALLYYADDRPSRSIETYSRVLAVDRENFFALRGRGDAFLGMGKHIDAVQDYERALSIDDEDSSLLNNYAWLLATSPDDDLRDGDKATELALKACEITEYQEAHILSTLASGYAELGDFETAIDWATKAVESSGDDEQREGLREELEMYLEGKPWRERQEETDRINPSGRDDL